MIRKRILATWLLLVFAAAYIVCAFWVQRIGHSDTRYNNTKAQFRSLEMKILAFQLDTHTLPHTLEDLVIAGDISSWQGPYAREKELFDLWGHPIGYEAVDSAKPKFRLFISSPKGTLSETYEP